MAHKLLILCLLAVTLMAKPQLYLKAATYGNYDTQYTRVNIPCTGGAEPYQYTYTEIPQGWKQVDNYLLVSKADL